jgi:hypothetical protein
MTDRSRLGRRQTDQLGVRCDRVVGRSLTIAAALIAAVGLLLPGAFAQEADQRFCIVPVANAAQGIGPVGQVWRSIDTTFDIPGLPAPVFTPTPGTPWTIDSDRRAVKYSGLFPQSYLDAGTWVREPWSGRVVALAQDGILVLKPDTGRFEKIASQAVAVGHRITVLPRRRLTVVLGIAGGLLAVTSNALETWLSADELAAHGVHGVQAVYDSAFLAATILVDVNGTFHAYTDDGGWYSAGSAEKSRGGHLVDAPGSDAALLFLDHSVIAIRKKIEGSTVSFATEIATTGSWTGEANFYTSKVTGQFLNYTGSFFHSPRWQRLTSDGFSDIPGGNFAIPRRQFFGPSSYVHDLPTLGRTLIEGEDGLYLYDGTTVKPVKGGGRQSFGALGRVYDLPSIGRVLITTQSGIFELTRDGTLVARPMPFPTDGIYPKPQLAEWHNAGVVLASTKLGIFVLDRELDARPIPGGDQVDLGGLDFAHGEMASTGDLVLSGDRSVFLAVSGKGQGSAVCQHERELSQAIPDSTLCLKGIQGTDEASIGFAIGGMVEAPRGQGLLVDTVKGLFLQRLDGSFANLEPRGGQYTRELAILPWSGDVLTLGPDATVVRADLSLEKLGQWTRPKVISSAIEGALVIAGEGDYPPELLKLENSKYRLRNIGINAVEAAVDAPWLGGALVWNHSGLFLLKPDGNVIPFRAANIAPPLRPDLSGTLYSKVLFGVSDFFAIDRFQTIYARQQHSGWFRLTRDRQWLPVHGLPNELALVHFDPGQGEILFGLADGIYAVDANGEARKLSDSSSGVIDAIAGAKDVILAGGNHGLFEISKDLSRFVPVANGSDDAIGSVSDILDVEFAGIDVIEASRGTYSFEGGKLRRIRDLSAAVDAQRLTVYPRLRRVLATKHFVSGPLIFELGRVDERGDCSDLKH